MAFCSHCGNSLDEGAKFCPHCKTEIPGNAGGEQNPYAPPAYSAAGPSAEKTPWQYFTGVLKKYAVFKGRARRAEYWWFVLFNVIFGVITSILDGILGLYIMEINGVINTLLSLALFSPSLCVSIRRMHDCGKSGWFMLIPIYGQIILPCTNGDYGPNRYGPDPKGEV